MRLSPLQESQDVTLSCISKARTAPLLVARTQHQHELLSRHPRRKCFQSPQLLDDGWEATGYELPHCRA